MFKQIGSYALSINIVLHLIVEQRKQISFRVIIFFVSCQEIENINLLTVS